MKVRFKKSPIGEFKMAYFAGDEVSLPQGQAEMLIEAGYADAVGEVNIETAVDKTVIEIPEKKKPSKKR